VNRLCATTVGLLLTALLSACAGGAMAPGIETESANGDWLAGNGPEAPEVLVGERRDARSRAVAHTELATAYYEQGNLAIALEESRIALQADSGYAPVHNLLGLIQIELKDPARARASFERALRIEPRNPDSNHNYGRLLCDSGQGSEGIRRFMVAVQNPLYRMPARTWAAIGDCQQRQGRDDEALEAWTRALRLDPNQVPAMLPAAEAQFRRGALEQARALVQRYNTVAGPSAASVGLQLRIERRRGDRAAASAAAAMLRQRFPDSPQAELLKEGSE
jgi:type IV pilus assembly protein PilF